MADLADYAWLIAAEGSAWLARLAEDVRPELQQLDMLRRELTTERARLVVEQIALRRRAADKFGAAAAGMFFTRTHLEQATDVWTARYKVARMDGVVARGDYCCGIGGDLLALAERGPATGWDSSPVACLLAEANLAGAAAVRCGDVETTTPPPGEAWHLDPDRRSGVRRTTTIEHYVPGPALIDRWLAANPNGAVKLAPAADAPPSWAAAAELEWITRDRECRQQMAWFGSLAAAPGRRRATVVDCDGQHHSLLGEPNLHLASVDQPQRFLFDPDASVLAANLLGALAKTHDLTSLGAGSAYLTGKAPIRDALAACFEVHEILPPRPPTLAKYFAERSIGQLVIKKRGVALDPAALRRQLKLRGDNAATLILTRIGRRDVAIVVQRVPA